MILASSIAVKMELQGWLFYVQSSLRDGQKVCNTVEASELQKVH